jgi:hypothetical protein
LEIGPKLKQKFIHTSSPYILQVTITSVHLHFDCTSQVVGMEFCPVAMSVEHFEFFKIRDTQPVKCEEDKV